MPASDAFRARWIEDTAERFRAIKAQADAALAQVTDDEFFRSPAAQSNSLAVLVKHMAGNLRSRWTDWLTTDGEKPDRGRDAEFGIDATDTRESLMSAWERGWRLVFDALDALAPADLERTVTVRGEAYTIEGAVSRQLAHAASHGGQIVYVAKLLRDVGWRTLSISRGESDRFNREMRERQERQRSGAQAS